MKVAKTTVDWFRFRSKGAPGEVLEALRPLYGDMGQYLRLKPLERGILGFQEGAAVLMGDMALGRLDHGGQAQRGWVRADIPGKGCEWVRDWDALDRLDQIGCELRRLDLALTTWRGEVGHEQVVEAHAQGRFCRGGRPPALQQIISTDPRAGRTCYVGAREKADQFYRGYEKGYELARGFEGLTHIDGCPIEDIYRNEVEFKAENRPIPLEVIDQRDAYFAGAYPFLGDLLPDVEADILMRRPERAPQTDLQLALAHVRNQFGRTLFTALHAYGGDIGAVWDRIVASEHNKDLLAAGVLMVEHD